MGMPLPIWTCRWSKDRISQKQNWRIYILNKDDLSDKSPSDDLYRISVPEWLPWCTLGLVVLGPSRFHGLIFQWSRRNKMTSGWNGGVGVQPKEHKSWCKHLNLIVTIKEMMQVLFATSCEVPEKRLPCSCSHCGLHHQVSINIWKCHRVPRVPGAPVQPQLQRWSQGQHQPLAWVRLQRLGQTSWEWTDLKNGSKCRKHGDHGGKSLEFV